MKIKGCPDCSTGWCYPDDLPHKHHHHDIPHHGLVPCPTCEGSGRIFVPEEVPVQFAQEALKRREAHAQRLEEHRSQSTTEREVALAYA